MKNKQLVEEQPDTELFNIVIIMSFLVITAAMTGAWGGYHLHELELATAKPVIAKSDLVQQKNAPDIHTLRPVVEKHHI